MSRTQSVRNPPAAVGEGDFDETCSRAPAKRPRPADLDNEEDEALLSEIAHKCRFRMYHLRGKPLEARYRAIVDLVTKVRSEVSLWPKPGDPETPAVSVDQLERAAEGLVHYVTDARRAERRD